MIRTAAWYALLFDAADSEIYRRIINRSYCSVKSGAVARSMNWCAAPFRAIGLAQNVKRKRK